MQNKFRGVMQSPVTPLKDDFSLDLKTFERVLDFHVRSGAPAISWPHHKGESLNLTIAARHVDAFLADKILVLWFAQKSGRADDFSLIADYQLRRTAGFALKKNQPRFLDFVKGTLLQLEASGHAAKIFDGWFAPVPRTFRIAPD
jgi:ABC-type amino acid transport substrate-binding protein